MALFTIADLHLPLGINKPMDVFGAGWENYVDRIERNWRAAVRDGDTVVIPGDFSWATYLEQAERDFDFLEALPGRKILLKGNHDYWWTTMSKLNEFTAARGYKTVSFLHNNSYTVDGISVCGTRGWLYPAWNGFTAEDEKYFSREVGRLELSLRAAGTENRIVFTHYPPMSKAGEGNAFCDMMKKYNVTRCYYGHLHSAAQANRIPDEVDGIRYQLVASDHLRFTLRLVENRQKED